MNRTSILTFAAGSLATAGIAILIAAGPDHDHGHNHDNGMDKVTEHEMQEMMEMSPEKMMAEMMRLGTPNEHHAELAKTIGNWNAHTSFKMDPSQPPAEGPATMTVESVLGGRYIKSEFKMDFMGQPFEGFSYTGYDVAHEQYIAIWADTMSTKITYMTGNKDDDNTITMHGTATTPMGDNPMKIVTTWTDDNHFTDMFYDQMPDGSWYNSGTITYSRD